MWLTKLLISPVKIRIFCPRTTKFGSKLAFLFIFGQALQAHLVPCWWVVVVVARAVSRKTPIYFIILKTGLISNPDQNGTCHNQNGTRQKVGTFMKIRRSPVSSDVRKAWRHNQTTGMKRFLEL